MVSGSPRRHVCCLRRWATGTCHSGLVSPPWRPIRGSASRQLLSQVLPSSMSGPQMVKGLCRTADLRFGHPFSVVAVTVDDDMKAQFGVASMGHGTACLYSPPGLRSPQKQTLNSGPAPLRRGAPVRRECLLFGLQPRQPRTLQIRQNLASIGHQKYEVDGLPSHLRSLSSHPSKIGRDQAATPLRFGMDDHSTSLPEGVQHRDRVGWRRIHIETERPEGIRAVHEDISQTHRLGESRRTEASLARIAESISQLRDRHVTEALRRRAHGSVWFQPSPKDVAHHRPKRPLGTSHKVGEHVAHLPTRTPRG